MLKLSKQMKTPDGYVYLHSRDTTFGRMYLKYNSLGCPDNSCGLSRQLSSREKIISTTPDTCSRKTVNPSK